MRIRKSMDIGKLKQAGSAFRMYLQSKRVYINKAQLGIEEGVALGWLHQAHPSFCYREDIKERLRELMGEEHKEVQYALFPKSINYKRISDGVRLTTTGVTMQSHPILHQEISVPPWQINDRGLTQRMVAPCTAKHSFCLEKKETWATR
jgi:hypothetical protein